MSLETRIDEALATARFREMSDRELFSAVTQERDDYVPRAIELARGELRRRGIADDVVDAQAAAPPPSKPRGGKVGIRWLDLYATLLLVSALGSLVGAVAFDMPWTRTLTIHVPISLLEISVAQGLRRRKVWGWYMNWVLLFTGALAGGFEAMTRGRVDLAFVLAAALAPNVIYFKRRRALFS